MRPSRPEGNRRATPGASPGHRESGPVAAGRTEPHAGRAVATLHPRPSARRRERPLQPEELSLDAEAARVAPDPPAGRDHAMAGDDDRDRVLAERLADRAAPLRLADARPRRPRTAPRALRASGGRRRARAGPRASRASARAPPSAADRRAAARSVRRRA